MTTNAPKCLKIKCKYYKKIIITLQTLTFINNFEIARLDQKVQQFKVQTDELFLLMEFQ